MSATQTHLNVFGCMKTYKIIQFRLNGRKYIIRNNLLHITGMKRDTIYVIFIVLIVGVFATNFIIYRIKSNALTIILTIITYIGSILLLVNHLQKKKS